ncbi:hypothetical protein GGI42DRAFT_310785 [Trichoderma sp. SZMC 28013]
MSTSPEPQVTASDLGAHVIFELPLSKACGKTHMIDISPMATDGRIRLVDCVALTTNNVLRIWEFPDSPLQEYESFMCWPILKYTAISYVWKGNPVTSEDESSANLSSYLAIRGAEGSDPISINVLRAVCTASLRNDKIDFYRMISRAEYLWLDQLCIVQTRKSDKILQIPQMYRIYKCCTQCLILPGGLQRLARLDEETSWASRAWTLQECLAPLYPMVFFAWTIGTGRGIGTTLFRVREVESTGGALAKLKDILRACYDKPMTFNAWPIDSSFQSYEHLDVVAKGTIIDVRIFGKGHADLYALERLRKRFQNNRESIHPYRTQRCYSLVWHCALMRTSSRPVDMVFSIMKLMGVELNPKDFQENDRIGATIALMTKILEKGGSADWLGMPSKIPLCPQLSTFPQFPRTDVSGGANYLVSGEWRSGRSLNDWICASPSWHHEKEWKWQRLHGRMSKDGYLMFLRKAYRVSFASAEAIDECGYEWPLLGDMEGTLWQFQEESDATLQDPLIMAVPLWEFQEIPLVNDYQIEDRQFEMQGIKFMIVKEHSAGKFHLISYCFTPDKENKWKERILHWPNHRFKVGGPEPL